MSAYLSCRRQSGRFASCNTSARYSEGALRAENRRVRNMLSRHVEHWTLVEAYCMVRGACDCVLELSESASCVRCNKTQGTRRNETTRISCLLSSRGSSCARYWARCSAEPVDIVLEERFSGFAVELGRQNAWWPARRCCPITPSSGVSGDHLQSSEKGRNSRSQAPS